MSGGSHNWHVDICGCDDGRWVRWSQSTDGVNYTSIPSNSSHIFDEVNLVNFPVPSDGSDLYLKVHVYCFELGVNSTRYLHVFNSAPCNGSLTDIPPGRFQVDVSGNLVDGYRYISYQLTKASRVLVTLNGVTNGSQILFNGIQDEGRQNLLFNPDNYPDGMYIIKVESDSFEGNEKIIIAKNR